MVTKHNDGALAVYEGFIRDKTPREGGCTNVL